MITQTASNKLLSALVKIDKEKIKDFALLVAAKNVLIKDITKKGELIIENIEN